MPQFVITTAATPKRDVDLFGETTVMVQAKETPDSAPVPVVYVASYVAHKVEFARRLAVALAFLDSDSTPESVARAGEVANNPSPEISPRDVGNTDGAYSMPDFVEDVVYAERLDIADPMTTELWKGWADAVVRRLELAVDSQQVAALLAANDYGMKFCPPHLMGGVRFALNEAYSVTFNQAAAA